MPFHTLRVKAFCQLLPISAILAHAPVSAVQAINTILLTLHDDDQQAVDRLQLHPTTTLWFGLKTAWVAQSSNTCCRIYYAEIIGNFASLISCDNLHSQRNVISQCLIIISKYPSLSWRFGCAKPIKHVIVCLFWLLLPHEDTWGTQPEKSRADDENISQTMNHWKLLTAESDLASATKPRV